MLFADSHVHMTSDDTAASLKLLDDLAAEGVTHLTVQSLPYRGVHYNLRSLYWKTHYDKMVLRVFGGLHEFGPYSALPPLEQAQTLLALGCDGIKMMQMDAIHRKITGFGVNDPYYEDMFSFLEEQNIPVCMHVADPEEYWDRRAMSEEAIRRGWFYGDGTFCSKEELMQEALAVAKKHPRLKITFAHFFFLSAFPQRAAEVLDEYPNVTFDLTPGAEMSLNFSKQIDLWHDFFIRYRDRFLFGTDCNSTKANNASLNRLVLAMLRHDKTEFSRPAFWGETIRGLELDEETVRRILWDNYESLVGKTPRTVNESLCRETAARMLEELNRDIHFKEKLPFPTTYDHVKNDPEMLAAKALLKAISEGKELTV